MITTVPAGRMATPEASTVPREPRRLHVVQGEFQVSRDPDLVLTTLLGSCVSACIQDPVAGVGGMNHFLLPESEGGASAHLRYGVHAMELLINALLTRGARRERLRVWLFGGARVLDQMTDIGARNAAFAEDFVRREELIPMRGSLGGTQARRVQFWPVSGRVRQLSLARAKAPPAAPPPVLADEVELF